MEIVAEVSLPEKQILAALLLGRDGMDYYVEILDDSMLTVQAVNRLEQRGYIQPKGPYFSHKLIFNLTEEGRKLFQLTEKEEQLARWGLTEQDLQILKQTDENPGQLKDAAEQTTAADPLSPGISMGYFQEKGFLLVKGIFRSKIYVTPKSREILKEVASW